MNVLFRPHSALRRRPTIAPTTIPTISVSCVVGPIGIGSCSGFVLPGWKLHVLCVDALETLQRDLRPDAGKHDVAVLGFGLPAHRDDVAAREPGGVEGFPVDAHEEVRRRGELARERFEGFSFRCPSHAMVGWIASSAPLPVSVILTHLHRGYSSASVCAIAASSPLVPGGR